MFLVYFAAFFILQCSQLATAQVECNFQQVGDRSGVICLSKTSFVFGFQDPIRDRPMSCKEGEVCANVPQICATNETPVCKNSKVGDRAACNDCIDEAAGSPVCINKNEYSVCSNGILQQSFVQKCPPETPYCKVKYDDANAVTSICSYDSSQFDCPDDPAGSTNSTNGGDGGTNGGDGGTDGGDGGTGGGDGGINSGGGVNNGTSTTTAAPPQPFKCTVAGFFADPSSADCRTYKKCQPREGGFDELTFTCSQTGTGFNPATQRCELGYKCV